MPKKFDSNSASWVVFDTLTERVIETFDQEKARKAHESSRYHVMSILPYLAAVNQQVKDYGSIDLKHVFFDSGEFSG